jgi:hypothetical protein
MIKKGLFFGLLFLSLLSIVSAQITITQPSSVYNFGDDFDLTVTINNDIGATEIFSLDLICEGKAKNLMEISQLWLKDGTKVIDYSFLISRVYLKDIKGNCIISSKFGDDVAETSNFLISEKINILISNIDKEINPGEKITIEGTAIKENLKKVDGTIEVKIISADIGGSYSFLNGNFKISLDIPGNMKSGEHPLLIFVYEKENNEIINFGEVNSVVKVKQVPKLIEVLVDKQEIFPVEKIKISATIFDQAQEKINDKIEIKLYDPLNNVFYQRLLNSGEEIDISFETNQSFGEYKIEASALSINKEEKFRINKYEKISTRINDSMLIIKNIGNAFFNKSIQIKIGEETRILDVSLDIGQEKSFAMFAPDGEYEITITDGSDILTSGRITLTGSAISIEEIKDRLYVWRNYILVWFFLSFIIVSFIMVFFKRKNTGHNTGFLFSRRDRNMGVEKVKPAIQTRTMAPIPEHINKNFIKIHSVNAQYEVELKGKEEDVSVFSIKFDNIEKVSRASKETFEKMINEIKESKGAIYQSGNNVIAIYTSVNTRTFENEKTAIRTAEKIALIIKEHNKKFREIINAGIGIHSGKMIIKKDEKIRFSPLGNTLSQVKRLSDISLKKEGTILLSEHIFTKVISIVKGERINFEGTIAYSLEKSIIREENSNFIKGFLKRNSY